VLAFLWSESGSDGERAGADAPIQPIQMVTRFVLVAPEASTVHLTGDFIGWSPEGIALEDPRGTGIWTADVPLPPGVYQYTFVVDGTEWVPDPRAVSQVDDGFGQLNSVVIVPGGEA
jgi:1,4-alpha-glucan branching enzyme